ncbi:hypothetical protein [Bowmanella dokdonensis]|uniref:Uncharacterized protein n=1 Tax=Bowmanella dokdonensis TaxID=751969 RepID=A0A939DL75_9ALTE|nr:hypothetical protein [Bowmanella dokdonensis]MBN7824764.1 hypothetical protein [Bowmanella dokdonensis]
MEDKKNKLKQALQQALADHSSTPSDLKLHGDGNIQYSQAAVGGQSITGNNNIQLSGEFSAEQLAALLKDRL